MSEWNEAIQAAIAAAPESEAVLRGLLRDESRDAVQRRNIGRQARWANQTGRIVGCRRSVKGVECYVVSGAFGSADVPVADVEVER